MTEYYKGLFKPHLDHWRDIEKRISIEKNEDENAYESLIQQLIKNKEVLSKNCKDSEMLAPSSEAAKAQEMAKKQLKPAGPGTMQMTLEE